MADDVAKRIKELSEKMVKDRQEERFRAAVEEIQQRAGLARNIAQDMQGQNEKLIELLRDCVDFVVETKKENGGKLPDCIELALIFLTERALSKKPSSNEAPQEKR
jgi:hypothetical protein